MMSIENIKTMTIQLNKKLDLLECELFKDWEPKEKKHNRLIAKLHKNASVSAAELAMRLSRLTSCLPATSQAMKNFSVAFSKVKIKDDLK